METIEADNEEHAEDIGWGWRPELPDERTNHLKRINPDTVYVLDEN